MLLICTLVIVLVGGIAWRSLASQNASEVMYHYTLAIKDKEVQLLKDGFEKSAAFFSLMSTARELALHGGLSKDSLLDDGLPSTTSIRFEDLAGERIPYWVVPSGDTCGLVEEQIPYTDSTNPKLDIGLIPTVEGEAEITMTLLNSDEYAQYSEDINDGTYTFRVLLTFFFKKEGTVRVECVTGCTEIVRTDGKIDPVSSDGSYEYTISKVVDPPENIILKFTATENPDNGDGTYIAKLNQVVVSIYDDGITEIQNNLFTEHLNKYKTTMDLVLAENSLGKASITTMTDLESIFYTGSSSTVVGILWSQPGIKSDTEDYLGNEELLALQSSGMTGEVAKVRYQLLYDYASTYVGVENKQGPLEYYIFRGLDRLTDVYTPSSKKCVSGPGDLDCTMCPSDDVPSYTAEYITGEINKELQTLSGKYNLLDTPFKWKFEIVSFGGCPINSNKGACSAVEECQSNDFEHYEYKRGTIKYSGGCPACDG
ncbi:MAG: hypothetical protein KAJ24_06450, partial [Candidatus Aenigmarchaeota archaeon]|nr:hypothetical protein [Candidatus Aenigmarchaeota archaeon]